MANPALLKGVTAETVNIPRLRTHLLAGGAEGGAPLFFIHGNTSSSRFFEETLAALPPEASYWGLSPGLWLPRTTGGGAGVAGGGGVSPAADGLPDPGRARGVQPERGELPGRSDRRLWALPAYRKTRGVSTDPLRIPQGTLNRRRGFRPPPDCFQAEETRSAGLGYLRRLASLPFLSYSSLQWH